MHVKNKPRVWELKHALILAQLSTWLRTVILKKRLQMLTQSCSAAGKGGDKHKNGAKNGQFPAFIDYTISENTVFYSKVLYKI